MIFMQLLFACVVISIVGLAYADDEFIRKMVDGIQIEIPKHKIESKRTSEALSYDNDRAKVQSDIWMPKYKKVNIRVSGQDKMRSVWKLDWSLTDEQLNFHKKVVERVKKVMMLWTQKVLSGKIPNFISRFSANQKLRSCLRENQDMVRYDYQLGLQNSGFARINGEMLERMIKEDYAEDELSNETVKNRVELSLNAIGNVTELSETGLILDFTKMKIGGQTLEDYVGPALKKLAQTEKKMEALIISNAKNIQYIKNIKWVKKPPVDEDSDDDLDMIAI